MNRILRLLLTIGVVSSLGILNAVAQTTAQINGTVVDESGAALPGVAVAALHTGTGFRRDTVTDTTGSYTLTNLPIGPYRLEASLTGFRTYVQTGIVLQVNSNPLIPVKLQLGALEETVSVEAAAPLVETRNPAIGSVIDNEAVEALPLEGRNVASLVVLAGGAVDTGNPSSRSLTQSRGIAVAGGQQFGVQYLLDGAMHNNWYDGVNRPGEKPVRWCARRPNHSGQDFFLRRVSGHAHDADASRHHHLHSDRGDDERRLHDRGIRPVPCARESRAATGTGS